MVLLNVLCSASTCSCVVFFSHSMEQKHEMHAGSHCRKLSLDWKETNENPQIKSPWKSITNNLVFILESPGLKSKLFYPDI